MSTRPPQSATTFALQSARALEQVAWEHLRSGRGREALQHCQQLNRQHPDYAGGWHSSSQIALRLRQPKLALAAVEALLRLQPGHPAALLQQAQCLVQLGREQEAQPLLDALDKTTLQSAYQHATLALLMSRLDRQEGARRHYREAARLEPEVGEHYYNLATVERFLGNIDAADACLERALHSNPLDAEAHKLRADLRRQTPDSNHVPTLRQTLARTGNNPRAQATLYYALAKELEDLEQWPEAFAALERGAGLRRSLMRYEVADDTDTMATIERVYSADTLAGLAQGDGGSEAIFVVGLPRTGTTLVERILGMHSEVKAAGELNQFARCLSQAVAAGPAATGDGTAPRLSKQQRVQLSAQLDFAALGAAYLASVPKEARSAPRFVDKMPLNFLYVGLIHRALPGARIVHLTRHPLDACFAIYKTLFADAYPFSYDLGELAAYYLAYHRLMRHWEASLPGCIHSVSYERLVTDLEPTCRELLTYCGLPFEPDCLTFHRSREATTTASASQVREPVHQRSVGRWQHFADQLEPLARRLREGGVEPGTP